MCVVHPALFLDVTVSRTTMRNELTFATLFVFDFTIVVNSFISSFVYVLGSVGGIPSVQ
jgi:hypothetical protein